MPQIRFAGTGPASEPVDVVESIAAAIAMLHHPHVEVVLHDVAADRVVGIWNAHSDRWIGEPSLLDTLPDDPFSGPYERATKRGERVKSVSVAIPEADGKPARLLCINLRLGAFDAARLLLDALCDIPASRPESLFRRDWRENVNLVIADYLKDRNKALDALTPAERGELVRALDDRGIFEARNAVAYIAPLLGISRALTFRLRARQDKTKTEERNPDAR